jgi:hypothetical protein
MQILAVVMALSFVASARAETPREELVHAYRLLKHADRDYDGHREKALHEVEAAGSELGLDLEGGTWGHDEAQWKSDQKITAARRLLREARDKLESHDRDRIAARLEKAIKELDAALQVG